MPAPEAECRPAPGGASEACRPAARLRGLAGLPGLTGLFSLLTESRCPHCARPLEKAQRGAGGFCPECLALFPRRSSGYCPRCGELAASDALSVTLCATCLATPPPWQAAFFYGVYEGPLRDALLCLKFGTALHLGKALAGLLASVPELRDWTRRAESAGQFSQTGQSGQAEQAAQREQGRRSDAPFAIVPVPLHPRRQLGRGFNQSLELARALGRELHLPVRPELLRRQRGGKPQRGLNSAERRANMGDAFVAAPAANGLHLLLLDDIKTTGATLRAAALALQARNPASITVAAVAATPK